MNEIELAKQLYTSAPLNKFRIQKIMKEKIDILSIDQKIKMLVFSFNNYDKNYNMELCLTYTLLWKNFNEVNWKTLILEMFPRKIKFEEGNIKEINTGSYFDIFLLNGIIGVSPFEFIFNEPKISEKEKKEFLNYLKFYGKVLFYYDERALIEDVVNFYELEAFIDIVKMKEYIQTNLIFEPSMSYSDLLIRYGKENNL
ncbi:hypothetical protein [Flavobacterium sp. LM4]|uniref:hypothetical protein n=1 Tax=Flavobacterium sp. LM4 TaxID=1938609 RepID=UPI00099244AF|nr:hypothetical protein [Flavobacterium sp. LM4]OOV17649.1 hypothetical protein BXU10_16430 [Flavobacterium sp. LM4]